jgi:hypothetical protein
MALQAFLRDAAGARKSGVNYRLRQQEAPFRRSLEAYG